VARRSEGQMTSSAVCTIHKEMGSTCFLVEPQNQGRRISRFEPQNRQLQFGDLDLKITVTVSWFGSQNQADGGLSVAPQNQWEEDGMGHASRSSGLLHREASRARIFQFDSKLVEERWWVVHVASSWKSREDEVKDGWVDVTGCIRLVYPNFAIFIVLAPRGILVFWLGL
jgi:hypothetical protein